MKKRKKIMYFIQIQKMKIKKLLFQAMTKKVIYLQ